MVKETGKSMRALSTKRVVYPLGSIKVNGKNNEDKDFYKKLVIFGYWQLIVDGDVLKFTLKDLEEKCFGGRVSYATIKRVVQELIREKRIGNHPFEITYDKNERYLKEDEPIICHGMNFRTKSNQYKWVRLKGGELLKIIQYSGSKENVLDRRYENGKLLYVYLYAKLKMIYNRKKDGARKIANGIGYQSVYIPLFISMNCFGNNIGLSRSTVDKYLDMLVDDLQMLIMFNMGYYRDENEALHQICNLYCLRGEIGQINMVPNYVYKEASYRGFKVSNKKAVAIDEWIKANGGTVFIQKVNRVNGSDGENDIYSNWDNNGSSGGDTGAGNKINNNNYDETNNANNEHTEAIRLRDAV